MDPSITVILNCYKRPQYLDEQIKSIKNQSIKPTEIWLWVNPSEENRKVNFHNRGLDVITKTTRNFKYHGRFSLANLCQTNFVALFDDDTIPGSNWFANCLDTMNETPGILGGAGCILNNKNYVYHTRAGWPTQNLVTTEVDLVGHAWFLRREDVKYLWYEVPFTFENGEDIQLSYLAKKYGGVRTYCPPHDPADPSRHSSLKPVAYGNDNKASSNGSLISIPEFYKQRDECVAYALRGGWQTVNRITL